MTGHIYGEILRRHARPRRERDGVVICGAYGRGNAGDDAILEAILEEMRSIEFSRLTGPMPQPYIWTLQPAHLAARMFMR